MANEQTEKKVKQDLKVLKLADLVKDAKAHKAAPFANVSDKRAVAIMRAVFEQASKELENTEAGNVVLMGLGRFAIKQVQVGREGEKVAKRRIAFRAAAAKLKKAE